MTMAVALDAGEQRTAAQAKAICASCRSTTTASISRYGRRRDWSGSRPVRCTLPTERSPLRRNTFAERCAYRQHRT
jgi:hypothetical protein